MYRPAIFTAVDDDKIGDIPSASTHVINASGYANPALNLTSTATLSGCRFLYAKIAVQNASAGGASITVNHSQFVNCLKGLSLTLSGSGSCPSSGAGAVLTLNNVLMANVGSPVTLPSCYQNAC